MTAARFAATAVLALSVAGHGAPARAQQPPPGAQMPDAKQMSGIPLPVPDLAPGTVTVRVVRGSMANLVVDHPVELSGGPSPVVARTNESGRAEFSGLRPGTRVTASTTVDGERLQSQEFAVPATGGVRVALVASAAPAAQPPGGGPPAAAAPPSPRGGPPARAGTVALSERSRLVIEMGPEALHVFNLFEIVNASQEPVQPAGPIVFELPAAAVGAGALEGSSPQATVAGKVVTVAGPFAPGATVVQFGYSLPIKSGRLTLSQRLPLPLGQFSVMAQKVGDLKVESPQLAEQREMPLQESTFIVGKGPGLEAGDTISLTFSGLPHAPTWPRNVALALAMLILAGGVWGSVRAGAPAADRGQRRKRLEARRDRLFTELASIEEQRAEQTIDPERYAARRRELLSALEAVYVEMDEEAAA
jgi:hypothetical protein